jgi:hypothetical protein
MKMHLAILFSVILEGCVSTHPSVPSELVMTPGMEIDARTKEGRIKIQYLDKFTRRYICDGYVKEFTHQPRAKRWQGSLGIYRPYGDGSMHAVLEEGQQHFESIADAHVWLAKREKFMDYVWNSDGLVVGWKQQSRPEDGYLALSVEVWQIFIRGAKAALRNGASNKALQVSSPITP